MLNKGKECPNVRVQVLVKDWENSLDCPHNFVCRTNVRKQPCNGISVSNFGFNLFGLVSYVLQWGLLGRVKGNISVPCYFTS